MYSRHSGFSIPKNYGGSRFSSSDEPETKLHRASTAGATRSAHSPTFVQHHTALSEAPLARADEQEDELEYGESFELDEDYGGELEQEDENQLKYEDKYDESDEFEENAPCDKDEKDEKDEKASDEFARTVGASSLDFSSIKSLFKHIDKDELIILGLIFLLISDGNQENDDIVAILVLLLLNGKI